ncbi:jg3396 [Pararge aegeria aegeria]|uniref:Jg3396 protein n=2 Tax=Pararge aegeria TaxID=116150 RepID=A0A8S4RQG4_9NEOP|nr:jg3396 [Pararge aegeria aegeria]
MSTAIDNVNKLQQDLQNELTNTNQLLMLISEELQKIKNFTSVGGEFEATIKQNTSLMASLANMQKIDILNLPPVARTQLDLKHVQTNQASMDESQ